MQEQMPWRRLCTSNSSEVSLCLWSASMLRTFLKIRNVINVIYGFLIKHNPSNSERIKTGNSQIFWHAVMDQACRRTKSNNGTTSTLAMKNSPSLYFSLIKIEWMYVKTSNPLDNLGKICDCLFQVNKIWAFTSMWRGGSGAMAEPNLTGWPEKRRWCRRVECVSAK